MGSDAQLKERAEALRVRQRWFIVGLVAVNLALYYLNDSPEDFQFKALAALPSWFSIFIIHVQAPESNAWWTNWAYHQFLALVMILYFSYRLLEFDQQHSDLIGLFLYYYAFHVTNGIEL